MNKKQFKAMCRSIGMITDEGKIDYEWVALIIWLHKQAEQEKAKKTYPSLVDMYQREMDNIDKFMKGEK